MRNEALKYFFALGLAVSGIFNYPADMDMGFSKGSAKSYCADDVSYIALSTSAVIALLVPSDSNFHAIFNINLADVEENEEEREGAELFWASSNYISGISRSFLLQRSTRCSVFYEHFQYFSTFRSLLLNFCVLRI